MKPMSNFQFNPASLSPEFMKDLGATGASAKHFLLPGQLFASREATTISTILGSCVAICLWSPAKGCGGMNHFLLPEGPETGANRLRYGCNANPALLAELQKFGCDPRELKAKIFGGASTFASVDVEQSLGKRNVDLAIDFVRSAGIQLVSKEISTERGCKLVFQTGDGVSVVKSFRD
jgi:chemotaxis protein CheD